nr:beta-ketoacyl synthase N-terminal-like domain-containing protein [uncultured Desulfuromonas sp.]
MNRYRMAGFGWVSSYGFGRGLSSGFAGFGPGTLPQLQRQDLFDKPDRRFGRMDPFSRLGLAGITLALQDADMDHWQQKRRVAILAETYSGCLETDCDYFTTVIPEQGALASPQLFAYTLSNTFLGEAALRFGLTGCCEVVNSCRPDGLAVVDNALDLLDGDEADAVVVGFCDLDDYGVLQAPGSLFLVVDNAQSATATTLTREASGALLLAGQPLACAMDLVSRLKA